MPGVLMYRSPSRQLIPSANCWSVMIKRMLGCSARATAGVRAARNNTMQRVPSARGETLWHFMAGILLHFLNPQTWEPEKGGWLRRRPVLLR